MKQEEAEERSRPAKVGITCRRICTGKMEKSLKNCSKCGIPGYDRQRNAQLSAGNRQEHELNEQTVVVLQHKWEWISLDHHL